MRGNNKPHNRLPSRLFATDRFPTGRLNIYSKPDILPFIHHALKNTPELQYIKDSCFGKLFELPARQCHVSEKLIHAFLTRQLLCGDSHTLWTVFRSDPIRFGIQEFGTITGLLCGEFPADYDTELADQTNNIKDPDWIKLFGKKRFVTIADMRNKLETDTKMPGWKKLQLALILIVDGVLIAHQQKTRPTLKYVKMVQNVDAFCQHPWGRESYMKTISCMKPPQESNDPAGELVRLLRQDTFRLKGFPLALQLLAFQAVPQLQSLIPAPPDTISISQLVEPHLPLHASINYVDILRVEAVVNLQVTSLIQTQPGLGVGSDVVDDESVTYMENLIANHYSFKKHLWPGGDRSGPILVYVPPEEPPAPKRNVSLKPRKTLNKALSRKQRRISNYFPRTCPTTNSNDQVLEMFTKVSTQLSKIRKENKVLRRMIKRRFPLRHTKRSAHHSVSCTAKKSAHRGCQTDLMIPTDPSLMEEDQVLCTSPVVSQYAAQLFGLNTTNSDTLHCTHSPTRTQHPSPVHTTTEQTSPLHNSTKQTSPQPSSPVHTPSLAHTHPVHTSPVHSSPVHDPPIHNSHCSPVHTSPIHKSPIHSSLVHSSPIHSSPIHNSPINNSPIHNSPIHRSPPHNNDTTPNNSPKQTTPNNNLEPQPPSIDLGPELPMHVGNSPLPASPSGTPPWLYTPQSPPVIYKSYIYDAAAHPNSPEFHHVLQQGLRIYEPISPEHSSLGRPRYDTSTRRDGQEQRNPITPETSPTKSSGFAEHAVSVNVFAATATSKRTSVPLLHFDQSQEEEYVDVSDSSPARPTPRHQPSDEECHLAAELFKCPSVPALAILAPLPESMWELFFNTLKQRKNVFHITPSKFDFSNKFILEIAEPKKWISTFHMEILMNMLASRHSELLKREGGTFTTPYLASGIQEIWERFKPLKRKDLFKWDKILTELVLKPGAKWMEDVTTVYTPMIWADRHWVGLAINLDLGCVEILDPQFALYKDKKVAGFMEPVLTALPYLVKKVAKPQHTQFRGLNPFYYQRMDDIYRNARGGDCGPLSVKFMEFHAHGDPAPHLSGITDRAVDDIRKQYAMDVYKTFVLPTYHAPTFPSS